MSKASEIGRQNKALRHTSTAQQLYELLRQRILTLELAPGMQLSRNELAAAYKVSQTPVREALRILEQEGLISVYPQSRTEVSRIDLAQARETQFLRLSLELEVVRTLCAEDKSTGIDETARILRLQETALKVNEDLPRFSSLDREFHCAMFDAIGVGNLWQAIQDRSGHIDRLRALNLMDPDKATAVLAAHTQIVNRLQVRDIPGVQAAVRDHLSGTLSKAEQIVERYSIYF